MLQLQSNTFKKFMFISTSPTSVYFPLLETIND